MQETKLELDQTDKEHPCSVHNDAIKAEEAEEDDPWALPEVNLQYTKWSELTSGQRCARVLLGITKTALLLGCLYFFVCSLDLLSNSFRLIGGKTAGSVFQNSAILSNPVAGLMLGVLATVLLQSSSTTNGIAISLVVAKGLVHISVCSVRDAIPIVMGANIGTSITNTLVSLGQLGNRDHFRRAFAGATVHDMFNWVAVCVLLPLEAATGYLYHLSKAVVGAMSFPENGEKRRRQQFLKAITTPFTKLIIRVDKKLLEEIAKGNDDAYHKSIIKRCCKMSSARYLRPDNSSISDSSWGNVSGSTIAVNKSGAIETQPCLKPCQFLFRSVTWSDTTVGVVLLVLTLVLLSACFFTLVRTLYSALRGPILKLLKRFINADFPGRLSFFTGYVAIAIGTGVTMVIQSSSVFTSALTPLVGIGILSLERMYALTLGANLGTTFTAVIIALSQSSSDMPIAFQVALCHVFFNVSGTLIFYPLPFMRTPIKMAKFLGNTTAKYRWFVAVYMIGMFVALPSAVFGLSSASWVALVCVAVPVATVVLMVIVINGLQSRKPTVLPKILRSWDFLPECMRSLEPCDRMFEKIASKFTCCCKKKETEELQAKREENL
ncbi:sodium-dependent phosphate transport protein 2B-like isoform X1 [Mya arenaria]|uniref:sodium-dependent phosphate transport protein 2B-like isoform X1 n=1 Tax=Mya arenaria TaxID=6604 RepID=UPI0022E02F3F|nr:sodium-dependent phosphate transport protein 2B-like isoform X1 [Mya arenaria]